MEKVYKIHEPEAMEEEENFEFIKSRGQNKTWSAFSYIEQINKQKMFQDEHHFQKYAQLTLLIPFIIKKEDVFNNDQFNLKL